MISTQISSVFDDCLFLAIFIGEPRSIFPRSKLLVVPDNSSGGHPVEEATLGDEHGAACEPCSGCVRAAGVPGSRIRYL